MRFDHKRRFALTSCAALALLVGCSGAPDDPLITESGYAIDVLRLDGTDTLVFDPDPRAAPDEQATIEFWVQVDWDEDPGFDPVVVANSGEENAAYIVAIQREADGLILASGDQIDIAPFDFSDGQLHHVALVDYGPYTLLRINQEPIAELAVDLIAYPSEGLYFGTQQGEDEAFVGVIGGFRLWDVAVDPKNLATYAQANILDDANPHPDLDNLAIMSDFGNDRVVFIEQ